jgi:hypothetical protein
MFSPKSMSNLGRLTVTYFIKGKDTWLEKTHGCRAHGIPILHGCFAKDTATFFSF